MQGYQMYQPYGAATIQTGSGTITVPTSAKLPALGSNPKPSVALYEQAVQDWTKNEFGEPVIGLVTVLNQMIFELLGGSGTTSPSHEPLSGEGIREAQRLLGVTVDGVIGPETYEALGITGANVVFKEPTSLPGTPTSADIGGSWYQSKYVIWGGVSLGVVAILGGTYYFMTRNKKSEYTF